MSILSTICKTNHKSSRYKISLNLIDFSKLFRAVVLLLYIIFIIYYGGRTRRKELTKEKQFHIFNLRSETSSLIRCE